MDYTVHGILQVRILEWVCEYTLLQGIWVFPFSRGSSQPRDQNQVSCIAGEFFTIWATRPLKTIRVVDKMLTDLEDSAKARPFFFLSTNMCDCSSEHIVDY